MRFKILVPLLVVAMLAPLSGTARTIGSFDIDENNTLIPVNEIHSGGPPKDGIPAIDKPVFISAAASRLAPDARVMGLEVNGSARAYPLSIMNWHEIVNDTFGDKSVVVTYCPLCGSGVAFDANVNGTPLKFGVSGLLYNSDVLLYDRQSESLWSQILSQSVTGEMKGEKLKMLALLQTSWDEWKKLYPETEVLSENTGFSRNYNRNPYTGYETGAGIYFPVKFSSKRYHPKERVLGVEFDGKYKAYPFAELSKKGEQVKDQFAGRDLTIKYNDAARSARIFDDKGEEVPALNSFWFAWFAFHPDTEVYQGK